MVFVLISRPQSQVTPPHCLVRCVNLLTGVLTGYVSTGFLTEEEACRSQLFTKAKVSFRREHKNIMYCILVMLEFTPTPYLYIFMCPKLQLKLNNTLFAIKIVCVFL